MKSISIVIGTCLLLTFNTTLTAQRPRPLLRKPAATLVNRQEQPTPPNLVTSCTLDTIRLTSQAEINNFSTNYPACTNPKYLFIDGTNASPAITSLAGLASLTQVLNKLVISHTSVSSLSALSNLTFIGDALQVDHNPVITNIGLNNLTQLGSIIFVDLPLLTNITGLSNHITGTGIILIDSTGLTGLAGLENIEDINGDIHLSHSPFTNISNLTHLSTIEGALFIDDLPSITSVVLNNLTSAQGILFINAPQLNNISGLSYHLVNKNLDNFWAINTALSSMSGLDSLTGMNNFVIWSNPNLTSLHGFEKLTGNIQYDASIYDNNVLTDISALSHITSMSEGTLEIATNNSLSNLTGLGNLTTIGGGLWITDNLNLTSLGNLNNNLVIHNNNSSSVIIRGNDILAFCSFPPICNYLTGGGDAIIHDNDPGCENISDILANCTAPGTSFTWTGAVNDEWNNPGNWLSGTVPTNIDSVTIPGALAIYPYQGFNITVGQLTMENGSQLHGAGFDFTVNGSASIDHATINGAGIFTVNNAAFNSIQSSNITAEVRILNYRGNSYFYDNTVHGNTVIKDSSEQIGDNRIDGNYFYGDLNIIHSNSVNGNNDFYEGIGSPTSVGDNVLGNLNIANNSIFTTFYLAKQHGIYVSGDLTYTSNSDATVQNFAELFNNTSSSVDGNVSVTQKFGSVRINRCGIGGTINVVADSTEQFTINNVGNATTGGNIRDNGGQFVTLSGQLKGNISCSGITGNIMADNFFVTGNSTFADTTTSASTTPDNSHLNGCIFTGDLTINKKATHIDLSTLNVTVTGNLGLSNTTARSIVYGSNSVFSVLGGDLTTNSNLPNIFIKILQFNGSNTAHIKQLGTAIAAIEVLDMSKTNNSSLILDQSLLAASINLNSGIIKSSSNSPLLCGIVGNMSAGANGGNDSSYVEGPMKKIEYASFNPPFLYPVGDSGRFAPVTIKQPNGTADTLTVQYFKKNPILSGYDTALHVAGLNNISAKEYWMVNRNAASSSGGDITLSYNSNRSGILQQVPDLRVAHWSGTQWLNEGNGGTTGNTTSATVKTNGQVNPFGPFTLAFVHTPVPVITIGSVSTALCLGAAVSIPFTVDSLMQGNNTFTAQLSDSAGVFAPVFPTTIGFLTTNNSGTINASISPFLHTGTHYRIRIVANNPLDTSVNIIGPIVIGDVPKNNFVINGTTLVCPGNQTYTCSNPEAGVTYTWELSGGGTVNPSGSTAVINWTTAGTYSLTLKTSNVCGNGPQQTIQVTVSVPTAATAPVINNTGRWLYASQAPAGTNYSWYKNGTLIAGAANASYYASLAGNYTSKFSNFCGISPVSNTISFAANSTPQTINFPSMPNKTYGDTAFVPVVSASSGLPVALELISGPATINTQTNFITITGTGVVVVKASQAGDNVYDTAAFVTRSFTVNKSPQTITFPAIPNQVINNATVGLLATASSGLTINYSVVSGPATVSGSVITLTGLGTVTVRASQAGDTNYLPAVNVNVNFCTTVTNLNPVSGYTNLCPATATYTVNNIPGATYFWRIVGGSTLPFTGSSADVTWNTPGVYKLLVSASGNCGAASNNDTLTVNVINSIQPDSVHNMLPANGAINQQLPLTLSWVPAHPANFYTFDLYLWRANLAQPGTPYASGLTTVTYTLPVNSGLLSNQAYKWMVVAHNGSCTQINTGPVQQFTLIPLPDLKVQNVQAPTAAFSGQSIAINWTVRNDGPGNTTTNQSWTDGVFLSFDSIPNFAIPPGTNAAQWNIFEGRPLLIGTRSNVSALDSGQQYTNSLNFTLPVNYSQPLYVFVIANYPAGANAPQQPTFANDTARAPLPIAVTLSPTPDLRVDTVFTPSTTFSGSTINLTYKVKNYGVLTPAGAYWRDNLYISQSPIFNINNAIPIKAPKPNGTYYANAPDAFTYTFDQLQADSVYTKTLQVVIPNYIFGTYFIYVVANEAGILYEGAANYNNANRSQVQVFLTPTPHLTVSSLTLPVTTASTTQPIGVNWNIQNTGFTDNIEKNKGHFWLPFEDCIIPRYCLDPATGYIYACGSDPGRTFRDSTSFGSSYWIDKVYLSADSTGLNSNAILVSQVPHGILDAGLNVPDNYTNPYATSCNYLFTPGSNFNFNTGNIIKPSSNYPAVGNFTVPADLAPGNYYVYVLANATHTVYEYPGLPETRRSALPITVQRPDATVSSVAVPATASGGQPITINYSVLNIGPGTVFGQYRQDNVYVSTSPVFDGSAQLINTLIYSENLPVGTAVAHSTTYTFPPSTSGNRYFYVYTNYDSLFRETNYSNNISSAAAGLISITPGVAADLIVSSIQLADTVYAVASTNFKYTVHNSGSGGTAGAFWTDSIFISCSPVFSPATSYFVTRRFHNETVTANNNYSDSFYINFGYGFDYNNCFPQTTFNTAYIFVKTNADHGAYEGANGNNNVNGTGSRVLVNTLVDHIVTSVTGADTTIAGHPYLINWTVKNIGYNPGNYAYYGSVWYDGLYFSTDSVLNSNYVSAGYNSEGTVLNNNQTYNDSKNTTTPNLPTGDYYVFAYSNASNAIYGERVLGNNGNLIRNGVGAAKKIHVIQPLLPDLTDSILSATNSVATGQPFLLTRRVTNKGVGATYPANWSDAVWLSTDFIPGNGTDILLAATNHSGVLQPGQSFDDTLLIPVALNVTPGNYVLISQVNRTGNVFESNSNNNLAFSYITVYRPAPADLIVESIMKPDTVLLGYTLDTAKWVIRNIAANAAVGYSSDGIYLSQSNVLDSTAVLLGVKGKQINMGPLARDTISLQPLVNNVPEGNYNVIVKTDLLNNIVESDKSNNTGIALTQLYVKVKELPLNVLTPNTLFNVSRIYKLIIPDSLNAATILVTLKSADSLTMKNQMFIGKGYIPSAAHFDYTYSTPNYGNQDIVMTSVTSGVYYISIRNVSQVPVVQNITLKAVKLPFAILNVNSGSGGNIGNVTVKISGSLFTNNMTAKLTKPGTLIDASAVYFSNSTTVYATFNLQGKPLGIYDVTLTKPDTSVAVLANGFSVVPANNGGLNNGGGTNTGAGNGNAPGCDPGAAGGINSQLVVEVVSPDNVFAGWPFVMQINYHNPTNVDIPAQVRILYAQMGIKMALTPEGVANGTSALYLELTEQNGPPGIIRAGGSGTITVYAKGPLTIPAHTTVMYTLK